MKISANKINSALANLNNIAFVLFYGQNYGLSVLLGEKLVNNFFSMQENKNIVHFNINSLKDDPSALENEIYSSSLFFNNNDKIIIIKESKDHLAKQLNIILTNPNYPKKTIIVCFAEELSTSSALRKLAENNNNSLSIPCYHNSIEDNSNLIANLTQKNNVKISLENIKYLAHSLSQDALISYNSIEKLILYIYPNTEITKLDIDNCIIDQNFIITDSFISALFLKNTKICLSLLNKLLEDENPITIVKIIQNHTVRLLTVKLATENNIAQDEALKLLYPPVFFNNVFSFKQQLNAYNSQQLTVNLQKLNQLEVLLKSYSTFNNSILKNYILEYTLQ